MILDLLADHGAARPPQRERGRCNEDANNKRDWIEGESGQCQDNDDDESNERDLLHYASLVNPTWNRIRGLA